MCPDMIPPGIFIEEVPVNPRPIQGVDTSTVAFVGRAARGPCDKPIVVTTVQEFEEKFGGSWRESTLACAVSDFFRNGGQRAIVVRVFKPGNNPPRARLTVGDITMEAVNEGPWGSSTGTGSDGAELDAESLIGDREGGTGIYALEQVETFGMLNIPPYLSSGDVDTSVLQSAAKYCEERRAMLLIDSPSHWTDTRSAILGISTGIGTRSKNAAVFFPRLRRLCPSGGTDMCTAAPGGAIAGVYARIDRERGVWKAPAGAHARIDGVDLGLELSKVESEELTSFGINCLRTLPTGGVAIWGARTLAGDNQSGSEWKYVSVRRLALYIEESVFQGTRWVMFEPNTASVREKIRRLVGNFLASLYRQGAFAGATPMESYFVRCDSETTTAADMKLGIMRVEIGFAPLKPAEFVVVGIALGTR